MDSTPGSSTNAREPSKPVGETDDQDAMSLEDLTEEECGECHSLRRECHSLLREFGKALDMDIESDEGDVTDKDEDTSHPEETRHSTTENIENPSQSTTENIENPSQSTTENTEDPSQSTTENTEDPSHSTTENIEDPRHSVPENLEDLSQEKRSKLVLRLPNNEEKTLWMYNMPLTSSQAKLKNLLNKFVQELISPPLKRKLQDDNAAESPPVVTFRIPKDEDLPKNVNFFLTKQEQHDCFFVVGSESEPKTRIGAVKVLLIAISEPLRSMLDSSELREQGDITLVDTDKDTFINFLKCVYGSSDVILGRISFDESAKLYYLFDKYLITELKSRLVHDMITKLKDSVDMAFIALRYSHCVQSVFIEQVLRKVIQENADKMINDEKFNSMSDKALLYITTLSRLNISEVKLWEAVLNWAKCKYNCTKGSDFRYYLEDHLKFIRFCSMTPEEFIFSVVPTDILRDDEVNKICKSFGSKRSPGLKDICNEICSRDKAEEKSFVFTVKIKDAENGKHSSHPICFRNLAWNIFVNKNNNNKLSIKMECSRLPKSSDDFNWECYVSASFCLVNQFPLANKKNIYKSFVHSFTKTNPTLTDDSFYSWDKIKNPLDGFIKNDAIIVLLSFNSYLFV